MPRCNPVCNKPPVGIKKFLTYITFAVACILGCSCSKLPSTPIPEPIAPLNIIAIDRSGSTNGMRPLQKECLDVVLAKAGKWSEEASIYVLDTELTCVREAKKVQRNEPISDYVTNKLKTPDGDTGHKTRPALLWKLLASEYSKEKSGRVIRVMFLTDGDNDWQKENKEIAESASSLSKNPNVFIAICGVTGQSHRNLKPILEPVLGKRIQFVIGNDRASLISSVTQLREASERK